MSKTYRRPHRRKREPRKRVHKRYRRSDTHHIRPKAAGGSNDAENLIVIDRRLHELIHAVFGPLPPTEYLPYIKRNPSVAVFRLIRGTVRTFGPGVVEAALKEATL